MKSNLVNTYRRKTEGIKKNKLKGGYEGATIVKKTYYKLFFFFTRGNSAGNCKKSNKTQKIKLLAAKQRKKLDKKQFLQQKQALK